MSTQSKDGKWLVIVQNDKYTASDFALLLGNIEGLCALKKFQKHGFNSSTACICLYYYGNDNDEILNI